MDEKQKNQEKKPSSSPTPIKEEKPELRKISEEKLKQILKEHKKWLSSKGKEGERANLRKANLGGADLSRVNFSNAKLRWASLRRANLKGANLRRANLSRADFSGANLSRANLRGANLDKTDLSEAVLSGADLSKALLVKTNFNKANLTNSIVYGISAWDLDGIPAKQDNLVITPKGQNEVTVDNLKVAQFIYLLIENEEIRDVIDTVGQKGVLILGRFTDRMYVLDGLRTRFRELGFVPLVFDFERPSSKDLTGTVRTLAGLAAFIVADLTAPKSTPHEAQAVIPEYMVPFVPIIQTGEEPYAMFNDLWLRHDWVMRPLEYDAIDVLLPKVGPAIIKPALELRRKLLERKARRMSARLLDDYGTD